MCFRGAINHAEGPYETMIIYIKIWQFESIKYGIALKLQRRKWIGEILNLFILLQNFTHTMAKLHTVWNKQKNKVK